MAINKLELKKKTDKFRELVQEEVMAEMPTFFEKIRALPPKDYIEFMIKLIPYGFAKVPEPRMTQADNQGMLVEERVRRVKAIQNGIPENEYEYEDEEGDN